MFGWTGFGRTNNSGSHSEVTQEPEKRFGEITIKKSAVAPPSTITLSHPTPTMEPTTTPSVEYPDSSKLRTEPEPSVEISDVTQQSEPDTEATNDEHIPPSEPDESTNDVVLSLPTTSLGSLLGVKKPQSPSATAAASVGSTTTSTESPQPTNDNSRSSLHPPLGMSTETQAASATQPLQKEDEFLLQMREKRKDSGAEGDDHNHPVAQKDDDDTQPPLPDLNDIFKRRREGAVKILSAEEEEDLMDREEAMQEEDERDELLDRRDNGESYNEDRLRQLELRIKRRNAVGRRLSEEEEEALKLLEEAWEDALACSYELDSLLDRQENGEEIDEDRLYELELFERERLGDNNFDEQERQDLEFFKLKRLDAKHNEEEYKRMLDLVTQGVPIDEDRFYMLGLLERRRLNQELTNDELDDIGAFELTRNEEHLDLIEMKRMELDSENGQPINDERYRCLELLYRKRKGESLNDQESNELGLLLYLREQALEDSEELACMLDKKSQGEDVDEDQVRLLSLVARKYNGESLTQEESKELSLFQESRLLAYDERQELNRMLTNLDLGKEVDEDRLYELQLREKRRLGEALSPEEIEDLEFVNQARKDKAQDGKRIDDQATASEEPILRSDQESEDWDKFSINSQDLKEVQILHRELEKVGLPRTISVHAGHEQSSSSRMSVGSTGDDSYLQDLLAQKDRREEDRREEVLEDALELYQVALQEKNMEEDEQLFLIIFDELLKEVSEKAKDADRHQDELIEREKSFAALKQAQMEHNHEALSPKPFDGVAAGDAVDQATFVAAGDAVDQSTSICGVQEQMDAIAGNGIYNVKSTLNPSMDSTEKFTASAETVEDKADDLDDTESNVRLLETTADLDFGIIDGSLEHRLLVENKAAENLHFTESPEDAYNIAHDIRVDLPSAKERTIVQSTETGSELLTVSDLDEQRELAELNDLYDRQDRGEDINEDRLYELELFDRYRQGEELHEDELQDLEFFKKQKNIFARLKVELKVLREHQASGESFDGDRMYFLELCDQKRQGKELSPEELKDLADFLVDEGKSTTLGEHDVHDMGSASPEEVGISGSMVMVVPTVRDGSAADGLVHKTLESESWAITQPDNLQMAGTESNQASTNLHNLTRCVREKPVSFSIPMEQQGSLPDSDEEKVHHATAQDESDAGRDLSLLDPVESAPTNQVPTKEISSSSRIIEVFTPEQPELTEFDSIYDRQDSGIDMVEDSVYQVVDRYREGEEGQEVRETKLQGLESSKNVQLTNAKVDLGITDVGLEHRLLVENQSAANLHFTESPDDAYNIVHDIRVDLPSAKERTSVQSTETGNELLTVSDLDEQRELAELNDLYDRQDRGEDINEDRLYELELFDRYRQGEELHEDELQDLEFFKKQKDIFSRLKVELKVLRGYQASGESFDGDRMYFLELCDQKRQGKELSPEELKDLAEFLAGEEDRTACDTALLPPPDQTELSDRCETNTPGNLSRAEVTQTERASFSGINSALTPVTLGGILDAEENAYKLELQAKFRRGEHLEKDELFELRAFMRQQQGIPVGDEEMKELSRIRDGRLKEMATLNADIETLHVLQIRKDEGKEYDKELLHELELFERARSGETLDDVDKAELSLLRRRRTGASIPEDEWEKIKQMRQKKIDDRTDIDKLQELRNDIKLGVPIDSERLHFLEQKERLLNGESLSERELYEVGLLDRLARGMRLDDEATEDLRRFRHERLEQTLALELEEKRNALSSGLYVDPLIVFGLELFERRRQNKILSDAENEAIRLLERKYQGENMSSAIAAEIQELLEKLRPRKKEETYMLDEIDREYRKLLLYRRKCGTQLDVDEGFELEILNRAFDDDFFFDAEISQAEALRESRDERQRDRSDLDELRRLRDAGDEVDHMRLYELELLSKERNRLPLDTEEMLVLDLVKKRRSGQEILQDEVKKLSEVRRNRELIARDEKALADILAQQARGDCIDEVRLHELQLFRRQRAGEALSEDELDEMRIFQKRRDGHELTDDELIGLELRKLEREEIEKEKAQIFEIKRRRDEGELIDGDFLYELELFHRRRTKESLSEDDHTELDLFEKRRNGQILTEEELDKLMELKSSRLARAYGADAAEQAEDDEGDPAYMKRQRQRIQKGERLHRDELIELDFLERQERGEKLSIDELEELELLRSERQKLEPVAMLHTWDMEVDLYSDEQSSVSVEKSSKKEDTMKQGKIKKGKKKKKKKEQKPPKPPKLPKVEKPKEKRMRRKKKAVFAASQSVPAHADCETAAQGEPPTGIHRDADDNPEKPPVPLPSSSQEISTPKKEEPVKSGFFGRLAVRGKTKKELELEEMKRRQEELIKEQLKAMHMEEEIEAMEKEREIQETLVHEAVESKSKSDISVSSWETDTSYEESEVEASELASEEDSPSDDSSCSSSSSSGTLPSTSSYPFTNRNDTDNESLQHSTGRKSSISTENKSFFTAETSDIQSLHTRDTMSKSQYHVASKNASASRASTSRASSILTESDLIDKSAPESGGSEKVSLPPKQITTCEELSFPAETDGFSIVSDGSLEDQNEGTTSRRRLVSSASRSISEQRTRQPCVSGQSTKSGLLSAHLRRQKRKQDRRNRRKNVSRHGDEISLGTVGLKIASTEEPQATQKSPKESINALFSSNMDSDPSKSIRPWKDAITELSLHQNLTSRIRESAHKEPETRTEDFFEDTKEIFHRSIFNFSQSKFQEDSDSDEKSGSLSQIEEDESDRDSIPDDTDKKVDEETEQVDSHTSLGLDGEQSFSLLGYGGIESKLASKKQDKEKEFNQAWETIEADRAVAAQMNQKRMMRLRDRAPGREEKKDEGPVEIPRLFLFEGEKIEGKKRSKKKKKKLKKLRNTLSKEFRKAMRDVFDSEDEEEYDRTFGEQGDEEQVPNSGRIRRRNSNESMYDSVSHTSGSEVSDDDGENVEEEEFDDDYLRRLRERSMQQEAKEKLDENRHANDLQEPDEDSQSSDVSRGQPARVRSSSPVSVGSIRDQLPRKKRKKPRKNRSGEVVYDGVDPADVYAQELEKRKTRTTYTISDLRKEMEEMKQEAAASSFEDAFAGIAASTRSGFADAKSPQGIGMASKAFRQGNKSSRLAGPGVDSLRALNIHSRPSLGRETSFVTHHSNVGLLGGGRKTFDTPGKSTFHIGGTLASVPIPEEDDEEAFLTGGNGTSPHGQDTSHRMGNLMSSFTSRITKPDSGRSKNGFRLSGFVSAQKPSSQQQRLGEDDVVSGIGTLGVSGFPEPLPVPEMQEDDGPNKKKFGIGTLKNKVKMTMKVLSINRRKQSSHEFGGMLHDDEMEGGLLD